MMKRLTIRFPTRCIRTVIRAPFRACKVSKDQNLASNYFRSSVPQSIYATSTILSLTPSSDAPSLSLLFSILIGLPVTLWTYKCLIMILLQRKIIYMGYIPPGTRQEKLSDVPNFTGLQKSYSIEEVRVQSLDKTKLSALVMCKKSTSKLDCIVLYLQGNAGNPLHRIPVFSSLLSSTTTINPVMFAPAPRSYWTSTNRTPTQRGILADYTSSLQYAVNRWPETPIVLYGHSLGGTIAVCLLAALDEGRTTGVSKISEKEEFRKALKGLTLENPFASIPGMVRALYPQRWLPYHYLAPLAWDKWDALSTIRASSSSLNTSVGNESILARLARNMLVLVSSRDEVVPPSMGRAIFDARPSNTEIEGSEKDEKVEDRARIVEIDDALHEDAWRQLQWKKEMARYLEDIVVQPGGRKLR